MVRCDSLVILGTCVALKNRPREAVNHRLSKAWASWWTNKALFCHKGTETDRRLSLFTSVVGATALWGLEAVPLRQSDQRVLDVVCLHMWRWMIPCPRRPREPGVDWLIRGRRHARSVGHALGHVLWGRLQKTRFRRYAGHVARMQSDRIVRQTMRHKSLHERRTA